MKRSEINAVIQKIEALLKKYSFSLPPYLSFTAGEWESKGRAYDGIRKNMLGWDVTIEEDEPPYRLLCNEYPPAKG